MAQREKFVKVGLKHIDNADPQYAKADSGIADDKDIHDIIVRFLLDCKDRFPDKNIIIRKVGDVYEQDEVKFVVTKTKNGDVVGRTYLFFRQIPLRNLFLGLNPDGSKREIEKVIRPKRDCISLEEVFSEYTQEPLPGFTREEFEEKIKKLFDNAIKDHRKALKKAEKLTDEDLDRLLENWEKSENLSAKTVKSILDLYKVNQKELLKLTNGILDWSLIAGVTDRIKEMFEMKVEKVVAEPLVKLTSFTYSEKQKEYLKEFVERNQIDLDKPNFYIGRESGYLICMPVTPVQEDGYENSLFCSFVGDEVTEAHIRQIMVGYDKDPANTQIIFRRSKNTGHRICHIKFSPTHITNALYAVDHLKVMKHPAWQRAYIFNLTKPRMYDKSPMRK